MMEKKRIIVMRGKYIAATDVVYLMNVGVETMSTNTIVWHRYTDIQQVFTIIEMKRVC